MPRNSRCLRLFAACALLVGIEGALALSEASAKAVAAARLAAGRPLSLLQLRQKAAHGIGPDFLGDGDVEPIKAMPKLESAGILASSSSRAAGPMRLEAIQALPKLESAEALATSPSPAAEPKRLVALQAAAAAAAAVAAAAPPAQGLAAQGGQGRPAPHGMKHWENFDIQEKDAAVLPSVRLERAEASAEHWASLFSAGARAAFKNAVPDSTVAWLSSVAKAAQYEAHQAVAPPTQGAETAAAAPGAMKLNGVVRLSAAERAALAKRPAAMVAVATTHEAAAAAEMSSGARMDSPANRAGLLSVEQQRTQATLLVQMKVEKDAELRQAEDLDRQSQMEDVMNQARESHRW
eukprot:CAMPEP_0204186720 /NCGR_PEP_ID=MMETSP0361-20130328/56219_1 /ASSEMBLY_ACC=CAM_ASM_000343 /TAXON_ID=268821 /ORGANISM="Scrippsiella Hangoei, Strain SHTV-5" /LENGTH=350 /DNA_ID=CAMNT_0051147045 /DNA_START=40 /DNA_END=1089 /DNA_ORIENTATION=+